MTRRLIVAWLVSLCLGSLACVLGYLACLGLLITQVFAAMIEPTAASLAALATLMPILFEIAVAVVVCLTRGPFLALAVVVFRVVMRLGE